ncbi:LOW QUALITY PROTEIN: CDGSH iron-sulfur domain-containing protein 1-like [Dromiciops gliroides]|uniref:LOW QUALITY PROTEIN: CDGSH iron-sulfur domain-containing protein 1-like n=1 Tax=Dromiciops gliroides TaxID=33562 RepID=UPI001CC701CA|nr:LOW QUALITY PROTEIN: CDGSH iron-sulfur domain-containing protein 1-like [Dromiciops gliroides]
MANNSPQPKPLDFDGLRMSGKASGASGSAGGGWNEPRCSVFGEGRQGGPARGCGGAPPTPPIPFPRSAGAAMGLHSNLSVRADCIAAVALAAGTAVVGYLAYKRFLVKEKRYRSMVNLTIQKDNPKVVHAFDMEDLGEKAVYCRCWRSKKFPFCDGAHTKHNEETGDNVGPLIIKKKEA